MGYSSVLWLDERPLRAALAAGTPEAALGADLGAAMLRLADGSYGAAGAATTTVPAGGDATVGRAGTFHSTDAQLLRWTGTQLVPVPLSQLDELADVDRAVPDGKFVDALGAGQLHRLAVDARRHPHRHRQLLGDLNGAPLTGDGAVSFWWVHHDGLSAGTDPAELGGGTLRLMRTHLEDAATVGSHANAVGKLGTLLDADVEFGCAWWGTAAYRLVRLLDSGEDWTGRFQAYVQARRVGR